MRFALLLLAFALPLRGAEVVSTGPEGTEMVVTQDKDRPWMVGENVCLMRDRREVVCGEVTRTSESQATVRLNLAGKGVKVVPSAGDEVTRKAAAPTPAPAPAVPWLAVPGARVLSESSRDNTFRISQEKHRRWSLKDVVCFSLNGKDKVCGEVVESEATYATVKLGSAPPAPPRKKKRGRPKYQVWRQPPPPPAPVERAPAKIIEREKKVIVIVDKTPKKEESPSLGYNLGLNLGFGFSYFLPMLRFEKAVSPQVSLGVTGTYVGATRGDVRQSAFGGFLMGAFHLNGTPFSGFFLQGEVGLYSISAKEGAVEQQANRPAVIGLVGWRSRTPYGFNLGANVGVQYVARSGTLTLVDYSGFLPLVGLDIGYSF